MRFYLFVISVGLLMASCTDASQKLETIGDVSDIISSETSYFSYYNSRLKFDNIDQAYDSHDSLITNLYFFEQLYSGLYFPLAIANTPHSFKLFWVNDWPVSEVRDLLRGTALQQMKRQRLIGYDVAQQNFKTVYGEKIPGNSMEGKMTFVKLWFVGCIPCVEEMPALNKIVEKNQGDSTLQFISMAFSPEKNIKALLVNVPFHYKTIAVSQEYIFDTLGIQVFPTHLLVQNGKVKKILNSYTEIQPAIDHRRAEKL